MKKFVCLRDDDTSYITKPEDLISGYGEYWGNIPVTLATIPFVHPTSLNLSDLYKPGQDKYRTLRLFEKNASADFLTEYYKVFPVGENKVLVDFLSPLVKSGFVEIAQHGVFHKYSESGPEMLSHKMSYESMRDAREYLEKVFCVDVHTFIPPSNTIDLQCLKWLKKQDLHLMTCGPISKDGNYKKNAYDIATLPKRLYDKFLTVAWSKRPMVKQFGMYVMGGHTFGVSTDYDMFLDVIRTQLDRFGFGAIATHYTCFNNSACKESFWRLLRTLIDEDGVEFLTADDYYHSVKKYMA